MAVVIVAAKTGRATSLPPFSAATRGDLAVLHVAENVFQHDDGVVDQPRKSQRQATEDHGVDGISAERKADECGHRRERDGKKHRAGRAQVAEEDENHHAGENRPIAPSCSRFSIAVLTKTDWSKTTLVTSDFGTSSKVGDGVLHAVDDGDGVGIAALLEHRQIDRALAVDAHDVVLDLGGICGVAHVVHQHRRATIGLQRHGLI